MSKMRFSLARLRLCIEDSVGLVLISLNMAFESTATCLRFHNFKADRLHIYSRNWNELGYLPLRALAENFFRVGPGSNGKNKTEK